MEVHNTYIFFFLQRLHFELDGDSGPGSDDGRSELGVHVISDTASDGGDKGLHESRVIATKKKSFIVSCVTESALQESKITEDETEEHVASDNYISPENTHTSLPSSGSAVVQSNTTVDSDISSNYDTERSLRGKKVPVDLNDLQEKLTQLTQKQTAGGGANVSNVLMPQDGVQPSSQIGSGSAPTPIVENQPVSLQDSQHSSSIPQTINTQDASQKPLKDGQSFSRNTQSVVQHGPDGNITPQIPNQPQPLQSLQNLSQPTESLQMPLNQSFSGSMSNLPQGQGNQQMYFQQPPPQYQMMFPYPTDPMMMQMMGYQQMMYAQMMMHQQQAHQQQPPQPSTQQQPPQPPTQQQQQPSQFMPQMMYPNWMMQGQMPFYPSQVSGTPTVLSQLPQQIQNLQSDAASVVGSHPTSPSISRKYDQDGQGEVSSTHSSVSGPTHGLGKKELSIKHLQQELNKIHVANTQKLESFKEDASAASSSEVSESRQSDLSATSDSVATDRSGANVSSSVTETNVETDDHVSKGAKTGSRFCVSVVKEDKLSENLSDKTPVESFSSENIVKDTLDHIVAEVARLELLEKEEESKKQVDINDTDSATRKVEKTGRRRSRFQVTKVEDSPEMTTDSLSPSLPVSEGGGASNANTASSKSVSHSFVSSIVSNVPHSLNQHRKASISMPLPFIRIPKLDKERRRRVRSTGSFDYQNESCPDCRRGSLIEGKGIDNDSNKPHDKLLHVHVSMPQHINIIDNLDIPIDSSSQTSPALLKLEPSDTFKVNNVCKILPNMNISLFLNPVITVFYNHQLPLKLLLYTY